MIKINEYITEELKKHPLWCEITINMFKSSKNFTKENYSELLDGICDVEGRLKKLSDCLAEKYPKEYLAYQPSDDEFLQDDKKDKIKDQIAEFIVKYIKQ
jgi:hypothetical protein